MDISEEGHKIGVRLGFDGDFLFFHHIFLYCLDFFFFFTSMATSGNLKLALAGVAQWIEHWTAKQRVASSIPSQGTCLGCRPGPQ